MFYELILYISKQKNSKNLNFVEGLVKLKNEICLIFCFNICLIHFKTKNSKNYLKSELKMLN